MRYHERERQSCGNNELSNISQRPVPDSPSLSTFSRAHSQSAGGARPAGAGRVRDPTLQSIAYESHLPHPSHRIHQRVAAGPRRVAELAFGLGARKIHELGGHAEAVDGEERLFLADETRPGLDTDGEFRPAAEAMTARISRNGMSSPPRM